MTESNALKQRITNDTNGSAQNSRFSPGGLGGEANQVRSRGSDVTPHTCKANIHPTQTTPKQQHTPHIQINPTEITLPKRFPKVTVRLKQKQLTYLQTIAQQRGYNVPTLIRNIVFAQDIPGPLFSDEFARALHKELRQMGNDINKIARAMDSGLREGFNIHFERLEQVFLTFQSKIARHRGVR